MFKPEKIIVHHSLTEDSGTVSWGAIRHYHVVEMGMLDIGYHAGVELLTNGERSYYEALFGRKWSMEGAHTIGENARALGICFVGNYDVVTPEDSMLSVGASVIQLWMDLYGITKASVLPHSQFATKTCPGSKFPMDKLMALLA
jgi:N-acetylmuramoyl-L-alanine amidase